MKENKKKRKGFTLIELLGVIVVLAIILAITVPMILNNVKDSKKKSLQNVGTIISDAIDDQRNMDNLGDSVQTNSELNSYCELKGGCEQNKSYKFTSSVLESLGYKETDIDTDKSFFFINDNKTCTVLFPKKGGHFDYSSNNGYNSCTKTETQDPTNYVVNNGSLTINEDAINDDNTIVIPPRGTDDNGNIVDITIIPGDVFKDINDDVVIDVSDATNVVSIGDKAFYGKKIVDTDLSKLTKLTTIGASAFEQCSMTGNLVLPSSLKKIGTSSFANNQITKVNLSDLYNLASIGVNAFQYNNLDYDKSNPLIIHSNVSEIGAASFSANEKTESNSNTNSGLICIFYEGNYNLKDWYNSSYTRLNNC